MYMLQLQWKKALASETAPGILEDGNVSNKTRAMYPHSVLLCSLWNSSGFAQQSAALDSALTRLQKLRMR
jgi:hypothetical protein